MSTIAEWLTSLGLSEYAKRFVENDIDIDILSELTDQDLEKLDVSLGHRRKMLRAIRELKSSAPVTPQPPAVTEAKSPDAAERRQLTVMFTDLVGSTALSTKLDPEDLRSVIGAYHKCVAETVARFDGFVAKYMGDGVLIYFGYPQAHEDDAERAVRAGLNLVEAVPKLPTHAGSLLQVRVGIATGLLVVDDLISSGETQEHGAIGRTPNLAARLQALAEPNTVVIDNNTHGLVGYLFEYRSLGPLYLNGSIDPLAMWEVTRVSAVDSRFEALRTTTTPLVGRDEEIELLIRRWQQARGGDGCVVLISGEPGIGKSRVVQSILEHIQNEQHVRLRYFCSPHHQDTALYSIIRQLERTTKFRREDTPQQRLAKLEAVLALATNDLSEAIPLVAEMLSIQIGDRYSSLDLSPRQKKKRLFGVFLAQLEGLAAQRPVLIVFEDVQWIDPTTRELMDMAVERATALRVLLIVTFRTEFTPPWVGRPHVTLLSLSRLSLKQRAEMILQVTGGKALPQEIANELIDRTDGIPLFIEELTKSVVETGALVDAGDRYTVNGPVTPLAIPLSLHASLQARLSQWLLTREVAQVSAALGRSFSHELISAVTSIPQPQLDSTLAKLVSTELIFQSGSPPDAEYTFKHALVQDAAHSTLLRGPRRELHCRITAVLEDRFPEIVKTQPELMARHCVEAGFIERAVDYRLKAGQRAVARSAMTEAVAQLGKGLDLVSDIADATGRQRLELDLQVMLGNTLIATKGYAAPEPSAAFARARQLCEGLGRPAQFGQVLLGEFILRLNRGELRKAEHQAAEIRDLGETSNEVKWKRAGSAVSGNVCFWLGKFIDARAHCEKALSLRDPMHRGFAGSPEHGQGLILINLCKTLACLGYVDQANSRRDEAIAEARRRRSPFSIAGVLANAWHADWAIGASRAAERTLQSAEEILAIAHDQGFQFWLGVGSVMQGWSLATLGQAMEGIPLLLNGLALCRTVGTNLGLPFFLTILAEVYGHSARPEEGFDCLEEAVNLTRTTQWRSAEAEMHRLRGTLLLAMNERAAAEESLRHALAVARRQTARLFELRAAASLALLWRDQGKRPEARDLLAPIYGWFTEGLDTPVLQDAKALLDELASA